VKGRERIYLDRFWNEFSADPKNFDEESREHYAALYAGPARCTQASNSSRPSIKTPPTTRRSSPPAS
jgi:hypothetical protein